jgi:hypothetical protein
MKPRRLLLAAIAIAILFVFTPRRDIDYVGGHCGLGTGIGCVIEYRMLEWRERLQP